MKPLLTAIAFISLFTGTCVAQSDSVITISDSVLNLSSSAVTKRRYPIKSCRIVFRFFNGPDSGTKTVIFDDWGNREKEEGVTIQDTVAMRKIMEFVPDSSSMSPGTRAFLDNIRLAAVRHTLIITTNGQRYIIDLDQHTGTKGPILLMGGSIEENFKQMGFVFARPDTLLGKPCKIWESHGAVRLWISEC